MLRKLSLRFPWTICLGPFSLFCLSYLCWTGSCAPSPDSPRSNVRRLSQEGTTERTHARRQSAIYNLRASPFSGQLLPRPWEESASVSVKSDAPEENSIPKEDLQLDGSVEQGWSGWLVAALGVVGVLFPLTYCIIPHLRKLLCKSGCLDPSYHVVPDSEMIGHASIYSDVPEMTSLPQPAATEYFFIGEEAVTNTATAQTESEPEAELYPEESEVTEESGWSTRPRSDGGSSEAQEDRPERPQRELGVSFQAASEPILPVPCVAKPSEPVNTSAARSSSLMMLYASPLCRIDATRGATPLPALDFEQEWRNLVTASVESPNGPSLTARPLTAASLQRSLSHGIATRKDTNILHLSAHGTPQGLVLEDGKGTAHLLSCELVKEMLSLRAGTAPFQLVVLNACQSQAVGNVFADSGIPHVVCSEDTIMDSWVKIFMRMFYTAIFCGSTVAAAFDGAVTSLRCQPGIPQEASRSFCLLPRDGDHDKVICPTRPVAARKPQTRLLSTPFEQFLPELPEDFTGRTLDVWSILQHLDKRRFVTVCNRHAVPGIGKSAVLDAVHRASALHMQMRCVKVRVGSEVEDCISWISSIRSAVQLALAEEDWLSSTRKGGSCQSRLTSSVTGRPRKCLPRRPARKTQLESEVPTWSNEELLQTLLHELSLLASKWQRRNTASVQTGSTSRGSKVQPVSAGDASGIGILLLIHGCGTILERCPDMLNILSEILRHCPNLRIVVSSQYRLLGPGCSQFKVVHYELEGLKPADAARLFLRRAQRPLRWKEVLAGTDAERVLPSVTDDAHVVLNKDSEKEVLELIASHPAVARLKGAPQALIELACHTGHRTLIDVAAEGHDIAA
mmetsp:Transcript_32717/g.76403  ORF Transcript_32717/g.76403 Transcript_32717/m.76403 type:complete len:850 (+) Transcript_32717:38-2587(+)